MEEHPYSIYVHIPFCTHRCAYCDFNTYAGLEDYIPAYVDALCREIGFITFAAGKRLPVHTIFFGGGTPSLLPLGKLEQILKTLGEGFSIQPGIEITLEANPGTVNLAYFRGLHALGINRISLGMQSANPGDLAMLERLHNLQDVVNAVKWSRQAGLDNLNLDLIFGLPHQSLASWDNSLSMALSLQPEHLSLYALTLEHGTPMAHWVGRGLLPEPDVDLAADMYELASERLARAGYAQYEISNWARLDTNGIILACRHNLQYWRSWPYLGLGAGAHGYASGMRTVAALAPASYIRRLELADEALSFPLTPATVETVTLTPTDEMGEMMMMGLRLVREGVSDEVFTGRFGRSLDEVYASAIDRLIRLGLLERIGSILRLTTHGRLLGNQVFKEFI